MALAFSNQPTVFGFIPATPYGAFLDAFHAMAMEAGWEWVGVYENGNDYLVTSPQSLSARIRVWYPVPADPDYADHLVLQFCSGFDPDNAGYKHHFKAGFTGFPVEWRFTEYAVWMNCCSVFIGAGMPISDYGYGFFGAAQGGVPYVPNAAASEARVAEVCEGETEDPQIVNEVWWSSGDDHGSMDGFVLDFGPALNFRNCFYCQRFSWCENGVIENKEIGRPTLAVEADALQVCILRTARNWAFLPFPNGFLRPDETPVASTPLLAYMGTIQGSLWDACLLSGPAELEEEFTTFENQMGRNITWRNYLKARAISVTTFDVRQEAACASLLLLADITFIVEANVAY